MSRSSTPELRFDANGDPIYRTSPSTPARRKQRSRSSSAAHASASYHYGYSSRSYSPVKSSSSPVYAGTASRSETPALRFDMHGNVIERTGTVPPSSTRNVADSNPARYSRASTPYNAKDKTTASAYWASQTDDNPPSAARSETPALRFDFHGNVIPRSANATPATRVRAGSIARAPTPQWAIDPYMITAKKGRGQSAESDSWDMHGRYLGKLSSETTRRPRRGIYSRRLSSNSSRRSSNADKGDTSTSMFDTALAYSNTYSRPGTRVKFDTPRPPSAARDYTDTVRYTTPFEVAFARSHSPAYDVWGNLILQPNEEDTVEKRERVNSRPASPVIAAPKPRRPFKVLEAEDNPVEEDTSAKILSAVAAHSMNISPEYDIMGNLLTRQQERRISPLISRAAYTAPTPPPALSADDRYAVVVQTMPDLLRSRRYYNNSNTTPAKPVRSNSSSASSALSSSSAGQAKVIQPTPTAVSNTTRPRQRPRRRPRRDYYDQDDQKCAMM